MTLLPNIYSYYRKALAECQRLFLFFHNRADYHACACERRNIYNILLSWAKIPPTIHKTPDFRIGNTEWELKTPTGAGKNNIQKQLRRAEHQAQNIILDLRASKLHENRALHDAQYNFNITREIKRLVVVQRNDNIIELTKQ